jgi:hypothetical protein
LQQTLIGVFPDAAWKRNLPFVGLYFVRPLGEEKTELLLLGENGDEHCGPSGVLHIKPAWRVGLKAKRQALDQGR